MWFNSVPLYLYLAYFVFFICILLIPLQLSVANPISVPKSRHYANPPKTLRKAIKLLINLIYQKSVQLTRNSHHLSWLLLGVNLFSGQSIHLLVIPKWSGGKNNVGRLVGIVYRYSQTFPHVVDNRLMYIFFGHYNKDVWNGVYDICTEIQIWAHDNFQ